MLLAATPPDRTDQLLKIIPVAVPLIGGLVTVASKVVSRRRAAPTQSSLRPVRIPPGLGERPSAKRPGRIARFAWSPLYPLSLGAAYLALGITWHDGLFEGLGWLAVVVGGAWGYGWLIRRTPVVADRKQTIDPTATATLTVVADDAAVVATQVLIVLRAVGANVTELDLDGGRITARWRGTYYLLHFITSIRWVSTGTGRFDVTFQARPDDTFKRQMILSLKSRVLVRRMVEKFVGVPLHQENERDRMRRLRPTPVEGDNSFRRGPGTEPAVDQRILERERLAEAKAQSGPIGVRPSESTTSEQGPP